MLRSISYSHTLDIFLKNVQDLPSSLRQTYVQLRKAVVYALNEMSSKDIESAFTNSQDQSASRNGQLESTGDNFSLGAPFPRKSKMVNRVQNRWL